MGSHHNGANVTDEDNETRNLMPRSQVLQQKGGRALTAASARINLTVGK